MRVGTAIGALVIGMSFFTVQTQAQKDQARSLKTVTVNRQLACVSMCNPEADPMNSISHNSIAVQITVISFAFDTAQGQTLMRLLLEPQSSNGECFFEQPNTAGLPMGDFEGLLIGDETGKMYKPGGQLKENLRFSMAKGQQLRLTAIYGFIPSPGETYTLRPGAIQCQNPMHSVGFTPVYGDVQFTF